LGIETWFQQYEALLRMGFFFSILLLMLVWQEQQPRRKFNIKRSVRWFNNLSIIIVNSVLMRLLVPAGTVAVALWAKHNNIGLFNQSDVPYWLEVVVAVVILDCLIYWQHRLFHRIPSLWRLHRMHHMDQDIDVTTGARFHPVEIFLSLLIKFAAVIILGVDVVAIVLFEIILNATSMFNHANVNIPTKLDNLLRKVIVTPDMHRVHHSQINSETDSNFSFNLSIWDKLFSTYQAQPALGHDGMNIGLKEFNDIRQTQYLLGMLLSPFGKNEHKSKQKKT